MSYIFLIPCPILSKFQCIFYFLYLFKSYYYQPGVPLYYLYGTTMVQPNINKGKNLSGFTSLDAKYDLCMYQTPEEQKLIKIGP